MDSGPPTTCHLSTSRSVNTKVLSSVRHVSASLKPGSSSSADRHHYVHQEDLDLTSKEPHGYCATQTNKHHHELVAKQATWISAFLHGPSVKSRWSSGLRGKPATFRESTALTICTTEDPTSIHVHVLQKKKFSFPMKTFCIYGRDYMYMVYGFGKTRVCCMCL